MFRPMLAAIVAGIFLAGCGSRDGAVKGGSEAQVGAASAVPTSGGFYQEVEEDGRIYVFGTQKTYEANKDKPKLQYAMTFVGGGPGGKTVVIEADGKDEALQNRLIGEYSAKHGAALR
jgi:hypothetical protein